MDISWYIRRLSAMGPREIAQRLRDRAQIESWRRRYFLRGRHPAVTRTDARFIAGLSRVRAADAPPAARAELLRFADELLSGRWRTFAILRDDVTADVDWHLDARNNARVRADAFAYDIAISGSDRSFDTKYVWELSRHHHTTLLAMAFWLTGEERYAQAAAEQIESWIAANPFLRGIHWSSGIEIGMRLIAFVWTRRLLEDWPPVRKHFEDNPAFAKSVILHQWVLAHRRSHGSSANNHLLYEMAGLYVSTCAMPWHTHAAQWRDLAAHVIEREFPTQTFPSGYSRELASDYNGFVLEALIICLVEGQLSNNPLGASLWGCARRMSDCLGEIADCRGHPPRQGDSDDACGLLLDAPDYDRWLDLAQLANAWFANGPREPATLRAWIIAPLAPPQPEVRVPRQPSTPSRDAGLAILRARRGTKDEIYCAFDVGALGYLSIAAHGHADTLAIELRYGGTPVLVDSGTYAYSGVWRDYFRSTAAHNTIELNGENQSASGGPFLWIRHARATLFEAEGLEDNAPLAVATGEHDGYVRGSVQGRHRRSVVLDRRSAKLSIRDELHVGRPSRCRMHFHLHPDIGCDLLGASASLRCGDDVIRLELPAGLAWRCARGSKTPVNGWYSPSYDAKIPTTTLVGEATVRDAITLTTELKFPLQARNVSAS